MAQFPVEYFTTESALVGLQDIYRSRYLSRKFAGYPKGVYVGFSPSVSPPSTILTLSPDVAEGCSVAHLPSNDDPGGLTIAIASPITLDLSTVDPGDFPIQVVIQISYSDTSATTGSIITRSTTPVAYNEVLVCELDGPSSALVVRADATAGERDEPLAFDGVDFGFMPSESMENLADASTIVNEIVAARVGLDGHTYDSLSDSLAATQSGEQMAQRLGLACHVLRSNEYELAAGENSLNVSGSFSETSRSSKPLVSLGGLGSETEAGALSSPNDTVRNVAIVKDAADGFRLMDSEQTRNIVFGRLSGPVENTLTATYTFTNAVTTVIVSDGDATNEPIEEGDLILGPNGLYYEIESIISSASIRLTSAYGGDTATTSNTVARRWTLALKRFSLGGEEEIATTDFATTIVFYFPAFLRINVSRVDFGAIQLAEGGRKPLPVSSTTVPGKTTIAQAGSRVGAIDIQNTGTPLGGGPFHTINFPDGGGQVVQTSAGVVLVGNIGPTGPDGPDGIPGPTGPTGPIGAGFTEIAPKNDGGPYAPAPGTVRVSPSTHADSTSVGHRIKAIAIQLNGWYDTGGYSDVSDQLWIEDVGGLDSSTATWTVKNCWDYYIYRVLISTAGDQMPVP